jgi:hypothetical protein
MGEEAIMCVVCGTKDEKKYCKRHQSAYENLVKTYDIWQRATELSWDEYLGKVIENEFTGFWAREVAQRLKTKRD